MFILLNMFIFTFLEKHFIHLFDELKVETFGSVTQKSSKEALGTTSNDLYVRTF